MNVSPPRPGQDQARTARPAWGVGISYRFCIHREVMASAAEIDFIEVPAEDYVDAYRRKYSDPGELLLKEAVARFPSVGHGSDVSVGSADPPPADYLDRVARFVQRVPVSEYSEHMTCTRAGEESVRCFVAIPFTDLGVAVTVANAKRVARIVGLPFLLENVCYHFPIPGSVMPEEEFLARIVREVDCGILLDITNVYINAANHHYDPHRFIRALPAERVQHAHYCGVFREPNGYLLDTHSEITPPEVWALVDEALACTSLRALILERDDKFLPWERTINEVRLAREIFLKHRPAQPPEDVPVFVPRSNLEGGSDEDGTENDGYNKELALFQRVLLALLLDERLAQAVDREGESALRHTGLGRDERRLLAAVPRQKRDIVSSRIRTTRRIEQAEKDARRRQELAQWTRIGW
jgi:uncharacterized protein (UPF0276 family)